MERRASSRGLPLRLAALLAAGALLALLLAACGGGGDKTKDGGGGGPTATASAPDATEPDGGAKPTEVADGGESAFDACAVVTQEEAETALGAATGVPIPEDFDPLFSCTYQTDTFDLVSVVVIVYDNAQDAEDGFQLALDINDYPAIDGLGDRAYNAQPIFDVTVLSGVYELSIDITNDDDDATQLTKAEDLARAALERLP